MTGMFWVKRRTGVKEIAARTTSNVIAKVLSRVSNQFRRMVSENTFYATSGRGLYLEPARTIRSSS